MGDGQLIGIEFGVMCKPIARQVRDQGFDISEAVAELFQRDVDALTRLSVRQFLSESEVLCARKRILKRLRNHIIGASTRSTERTHS